MRRAVLGLIQVRLVGAVEISYFGRSRLQKKWVAGDKNFTSSREVIPFLRNSWFGTKWDGDSIRRNKPSEGL